MLIGRLLDLVTRDVVAIEQHAIVRDGRRRGVSHVIDRFLVTVPGVDVVHQCQGAPDVQVIRGAPGGLEFDALEFAVAPVDEDHAALGVGIIIDHAGGAVVPAVGYRHTTLVGTRPGDRVDGSAFPIEGGAEDLILPVHGVNGSRQLQPAVQGAALYADFDVRQFLFHCRAKRRFVISNDTRRAGRGERGDDDIVREHRVAVSRVRSAG